MDSTLEIISAYKALHVKATGKLTKELYEAFADPEVDSYARSQMRYEVLTTAFGLEAGHRALAEVDNQILEALELFPEAGKLLKMEEELWK